MGRWTQVMGGIGGAVAVLTLAGCLNKPVVVAPPGAPVKAEEPARPRVMSWRVASAHLEDIFEQSPHSSIDDFRKDTPEEERLRVNAAGGEEGIREDKAYVYGEPAPMTTDLMLKRMGAGEGDVLYDLGCGRGFFLMQALLTTPLRKAVGVELATSRVEIGKAAQGFMAREGLLPPEKTLELREQDMAVTDLSDATLVYMDSVFYSEELLKTVARHLSRARNFRSLVMIMKGLPPNPWFELEGKERWKMSWSPKFGSDVLFYKRTAAPAE